MHIFSSDGFPNDYYDHKEDDTIQDEVDDDPVPDEGKLDIGGDVEGADADAQRHHQSLQGQRQ